MDEDIIVAALGVLLTQVRSARRAIEEVERNTSRYLGFEFAQALSEGPRFGAPPMYQGALRVHVININDLAPGNSFGDLLMGLLGGAGNFIGGLIGGVAGGTLAGLALPDMIARLERIVTAIQAIVARIGTSPTPAQPATPEAATPPATNTGETLLTTVEGIGRLVRNLTALFMAASAGPGDTARANAAGRAGPEVMSSAGERWMAIIGGVNSLLERTQNIVNGIIILVPMVIGSIALLIANFAGIRRTILETMQFVLRNLLVLRGVLLTIIFETVASAARLVSAIVGLLSTAIQGALTAIFSMINAILNAAFDALTTLATTLQSIIGTLLRWLVEGVFATLRAIGDLTVFRTIDHVVRILPAILEPIYNIVVAYKSGAASAGFPSDLRTMLSTAFSAGMAPSGTTGTAAPTSTADAITALGTFPDLTTDIDALRATLTSAVTATGESLTQATIATFDAAGGALSGLEGRMSTAIRSETDLANGILSRNIGTLTARADRLAGAIAAPLTATSPPTGFEAISSAYERWLTGDGLSRTLNLATQQFRASATSTEGASSLSLLRGQFDRPRASVEIERVEIVVGDEAPPAQAPNPLPDLRTAATDMPMTDESIWRAWHRYNLDLEDRCVVVNDVREILA